MRAHRTSVLLDDLTGLCVSYPIVAGHLLTPGERGRIASCGMPMVLHRESGATLQVTNKCRSRYCAHCQPRYAARVSYCIEESVERALEACELSADDAQSVLLTLTAPPLKRGLSRRALRAGVNLHRLLWKETMSRVRWERHHRERGNFGRVELVPPGRPDPHPSYSTTWNGERWSDPEQPDGYAWALEVTDGKSGRAWHPHRHVICATVSLAERINAAYQQAAVALQLVPEGRWLRTDIRVVPTKVAAHYLAAYISGKNELAKLSPEAKHAYIRATKSVHRHDAGGSYRPLGIGRKPSEDRVTHVELPWSGQNCWDASRYTHDERQDGKADEAPALPTIVLPVGQFFRARNVRLLLYEGERVAIHDRKRGSWDGDIFEQQQRARAAPS